MINRFDGDYIEDIINAINSIEKFVEGYTCEEFIEDEKTYEAVIRKFGIIGEACSKISKETRGNHPEIPWREIISMRNKVVHDYFGVDLITIWETIEINFPDFKILMKSLLKEIDE
jgi:uncharacterized protein with HEPN domain